jgi:crotonobetaine/carnitine-CoA ligase
MSEWSDWYRREDPTEWVLPRLLARRTEQHPDRDYLRFGDGPWLSYGEVRLRANRVANGLLAHGIAPGDTVATMLPNSEDNVTTWFGILTAGAVQCPINTAYRGDFLSWAINLPKARILVIADCYLDRLEQIERELPELERVVVWPSPAGASGDVPGRLPREFLTELMEAPDADPGVEVASVDDARIMFTSGTTGRSKGVIKQHASDYFSGRTYNEVCGVTEDDTVFSCLPLFHSNAQVLAGYPAMIAGARVCYVERYSASRFWDQVIDAEATIFNTVSAINYFIWSTPPSDLDRAHKVTRVMAMPAPKDIYFDFQERFGIRFHEGYGLTETGMVTYVPPDEGPKPGSCGKSTPGFEVYVVDPETDLPLPPSTPGEIVVDMKIPNIMMRAYTGMPQKTADDFRNLKLHTGDIGEMDAHGWLYFRDRLKDYIRRRGENVSSQEVERIVAEFHGVAEAAAVGVEAHEGASAEQEIMVCVVVEEGENPDPHALLSHCAKRMPYFAVPRYVRFMDALPKTPTARVRKVELRELGADHDCYDRATSGPELGR